MKCDCLLVACVVGKARLRMIVVAPADTLTAALPPPTEAVDDDTDAVAAEVGVEIASETETEIGIGAGGGGEGTGSEVRKVDDEMARSPPAEIRHHVGIVMRTDGMMINAAEGLVATEAAWAQCRIKTGGNLPVRSGVAMARRGRRMVWG